MGLYQRAVQLSVAEKPKGLFQKSLNYISGKGSQAPLPEVPAAPGNESGSVPAPKWIGGSSQSDPDQGKTFYDENAISSVLEAASAQNMQTVLIEISLTALVQQALLASKPVDKAKLQQEYIRIFNSFLTEKDRLFLNLPEKILMTVCRRRLPSDELFFHQWKSVFKELHSSEIDFKKITRTFFCPKDSAGIQQAMEWIKTFR
jgi:hypothetical protein